MARCDVWPDRRMSCYAPMSQLADDPFGPLAGYGDQESPWTDPTWSRLSCSIYPVLEVCLDAYYVSISSSLQTGVELERHTTTLRRLVREGADVDAADEASGGSSLHFAAASGSHALCALLLQAGARPTARDRRLRTPFFWALDEGHAAVCRLLLEQRSGRTVAAVPDADGMLPLHEAASLGCAGAVHLLAPFMRPKLGVDVRGGQRLRTPLHLAAERCHYDTCRALVDAEADPQLSCCGGKTALHYAAARGAASVEICALFTERQPTCRQMRDASGCTPMELAQRHGRLTPELEAVLQYRRSERAPELDSDSHSPRAAASTPAASTTQRVQRRRAASASASQRRGAALVVRRRAPSCPRSAGAPSASGQFGAPSAHGGGGERCGGTGRGAVQNDWKLLKGAPRFALEKFMQHMDLLERGELRRPSSG